MPSQTIANGVTMTDRPLYEPEWYGDRVFLFSRRSHSPATKELLKRFKGYTKKVNEGTLITLFPGAEIYFEDWWQKEQGKYEGITFLYSEGL